MFRAFCAYRKIPECAHFAIAGWIEPAFTSVALLNGCNTSQHVQCAVPVYFTKTKVGPKRDIMIVNLKRSIRYANESCKLKLYLPRCHPKRSHGCMWSNLTERDAKKAPSTSCLRAYLALPNSSLCNPIYPAMRSYMYLSPWGWALTAFAELSLVHVFGNFSPRTPNCLWPATRGKQSPHGDLHRYLVLLCLCKARANVDNQSRGISSRASLARSKWWL